MSEYATEETGFAEEDVPERPARPRNTKHRVRRTTSILAQGHPQGLGETLLETENETEAKNYMAQNHPRGREAVLQHADGRILYYDADHAAQGISDGWSEREDDE